MCSSLSWKVSKSCWENFKKSSPKKKVKLKGLLKIKLLFLNKYWLDILGVFLSLCHLKGQTGALLNCLDHEMPLHRKIKHRQLLFQNVLL